MIKNVKVDEKKCIGCASCAAICPEVFRMENGKAKVIGKPDGNEDKIRMAKDACPVGGISFEEQ